MKFDVKNKLTSPTVNVQKYNCEEVPGRHFQVDKLDFVKVAGVDSCTTNRT